MRLCGFARLQGHHRYDVKLLINGVPVVQTEFKKLSISPGRAMEQIVE